MILELDAGNTRVKWRIIDELGKRRGGGFLNSDATAGDMLKPLLAARDLHAARMVSVASSVVSQSIAFMLQAAFGIDLQLAKVKAECSGVRNPYKVISKLGADRWLAVLAANKRYGPNCLIVDCGSATTVELMARGEYLGGVISPGASLMYKALYSDTHQVKVEHSVPSELGVGDNTESAVDNGVWGAQVGLISFYRNKLLEELGQGVGVEIVLCGGDAQRVAPLLPFAYRLDEELVLDGLEVACPIVRVLSK
ncbi:type III pantothenate kinase [uncultured Pseudoteredinibacter sp.]|uniref:type III pantothenate kinase n=1 Tax=uncultured Pseudoteredinibacter sp. TaxID=1641701 RepID=UPI0026314348|nr:type III pantothenate kinase [uncultured Pseudoteredinibacter sp.]